MIKTLVSVIIPCYNLGDYIQETINSVLSQSYKNFELIIVNDGSTDKKTNKFLREYTHSKVTIYNTNNQGLARARNYGIKCSHGEFVCCIDADDKYHPDFLKKTIAAFEKNKDNNIGIVSTNMAVFENTIASVKLNSYSPANMAVSNQLHVASLYKKECWTNVGGYSTNLSGYQDWDFWIKIISHGYIWTIIPEELFFYRDRKNSMVKTSNKKQVSLYNTIVDNNKIFYKEHAIEIIKQLNQNNFNLSQQLNNIYSSKFFYLWQTYNKILKKIKIKR